MIMVTLEEVKAHVRIEDDIEDDLIAFYIDSAEDLVLSILDRTVENLYTTYGDIPPAVKHAVYMLVDHSYKYRCPISQQQLYMVPYTVDAKLKPYMNL